MTIRMHIHAWLRCDYCGRETDGVTYSRGLTEARLRTNVKHEARRAGWKIGKASARTEAKDVCPQCQGVLTKTTP